MNYQASGNSTEELTWREGKKENKLPSESAKFELRVSKEFGI